MNNLSIIKEIVTEKKTIIEIFQSISDLRISGCLQISDSSIEYFCYFDRGHLIYSTNSLSPLERLKRNLHRLRNRNKTLTNEIIHIGTNRFGCHLHDSSGIPTDYQCISWLYNEKYISSKEVTLVCARIIYEVCESLFCFKDKFYSDFITDKYKITKFCQYKVTDFIASCEERLQAWQTFIPQIYSSYQRPIFSFDSPGKNNLGLAEHQTLFRLLKGLSFRQLAALIDKDEILIAKILYPSIVNNAIILKEPKSPFDRLPKIISQEVKIPQRNQVKLKSSTIKKNNDVINRNWKIVCIGQSIKTQYQINYFLDKKTFSIFSFDDTSAALYKMNNLSPDLILLEQDLEEINSHDICSLIKKQSQFEKVPIIILSKEKGFINRTKAKLAGADAYLTKPLNRSDLLAIILKYIDCN